MENSAVDEDLEIVDFRRGLSDIQKQKIVPVATVPSEMIAAAGKVFKSYGQSQEGESLGLNNVPDACTVYEHKDFNGQLIFHVLKPMV